MLQVGVWGHHTDPALECSEQEGGRGGGLSTQYCPVTSVPVCAGSSVTAAFKDEQAVGLRSLLAWVVLMQPGGELWPNQGRAYTPLVAVSEGCLPVTSPGEEEVGRPAHRDPQALFRASHLQPLPWAAQTPLSMSEAK